MSNHPITLVIVYDHRFNSAQWMIYSTATRLVNAIEVYEIIGEDHPRYAEILQLAGPKPEVIAQETC